MAKELGTSRTPLREALINLEQEGFVQSERACGFSVPPLTGREVREIYPILWTLEGLALRASGNAVCSRIDDLLRINTEFAGSEDANERIRCDARWHEALLSSCPNRRLNALIGSLRNAIRRYEHIYMSDAALVLGSVQQHQQIIDALKAKNGIEAEKLLAENWRLGMELLLVRLGEP